LLSRQAHAGQPELFDGVQQASSDPSSVLIKYQWGGGGFLVSHDGAKEFGLVCSSSVSSELRSNTLLVHRTGADRVFVGSFSGLWRGDGNGCGFVAVDALKDAFVTAIAGDPDDPMRTYVTTAKGDAAARNGVFANDGTSDTWTALGSLDPAWIQTLHVVTTSSGKRFWETKVFPSPPDPQSMLSDNVVHYVTRYSDDEAATWTEHELSPVTQFGMEDPRASFRLIAVDPKNPDGIYGVVIRNSLPSDLLFSASRGEPGTWSKLAEVTEFGGIAITPDGKLYFSDQGQMTKQVAVIDGPNSSPRKLTEQYIVGCLHWDDSQKRMLACRQFQFGTIDLESGAFSVLYDMRCGERFSHCPGIESACAAQLSSAWCSTGHYPSAPLCAGYDIAGRGEFNEKYVEFDCVDGFAVPRSQHTTMLAGTGGSAGGEAATTGEGSLSGAAGSAAAAPNTMTAPAMATTACSCRIEHLRPGGSSRAGTSLVWAIGLSAFVRMGRRRKRAVLRDTGMQPGWNTSVPGP
jgi:hypothetical protein